jgi:hypothetical protein
MRITINSSHFINREIQAALFASVALVMLTIAGCSNPSIPPGEDANESSASTPANVSASVPDKNLDGFLNADFGGDDYVERTGECCTGPGQVTECWLADAEDDGVTCKEDADCPSNSCDTERGLCICATDDDCNDGVCTDDNLCGPSWCNGYRLCSCWGGCDRVDGDRAYDVLCAANNQACCEGSYPIEPDYRDNSDSTTGYCSSCDDGNPCTDDICNGIGGCIHVPNIDGCDDGDVCTENDVCTEGVCGGTPVVCADDNVCTDDRCVDEVGCIFTDNTASCDDGDACMCSTMTRAMTEMPAPRARSVGWESAASAPLSTAVTTTYAPMKSAIPLWVAWSITTAMPATTAMRARR